MASRLGNAIGLLAFTPVASSASCFIEDQMYSIQPGGTVPSPLFFQKPEDCQAECSRQSLTCSYFSYSTQPDPDIHIYTPGACWLMDKTASLKEGNGFISGPAQCPSANTTGAPVAIAGGVAVGTTLEATGPQIVGEGETCNPTVAPNFQKNCKDGLQCVTPANLVGASGVCKEIEKVARNSEGASEAASSEQADTDDSGGGGFPIWGYVLIALAVVGIAGAAYFLCAKKKGLKKKPKRGAKVSGATATSNRADNHSANNQDMPNSVAETEPLIAGQEAEPVQQPFALSGAMPTVPMQSLAPGGSLAMQQMPSQQMPLVSGHVLPYGSQLMPMYSMPPVPTTPLGSVANPYANNPYAQPAQPLQSYPFAPSGPMAEPGASYPPPMGSQYVYR